MNNKPKRYRLLKDLPDAKAGTIYEQIKTGDYFRTPTKMGNPQSADFYCADTVENNPEWFEEIKEPKKIEVVVNGAVWINRSPQKLMVSLKDNDAMFSESDIPAIKEAIERALNNESVFGGKNYNWWLTDEDGQMGTIKLIRKYTQEELDKAIVDAFVAARKDNMWFVGGREYKNANEYLLSLYEKKSI